MNLTTYLTERITTDPDRCGGRPTVRGTRLEVTTVLGHLAAGDTFAELLAAFPTLEAADISACLAFAQQVVRARYSG